MSMPPTVAASDAAEGAADDGPLKYGPSAGPAR